jgi:hypothetical protein
MLPCVDVFVADEFCVCATILRTCLALRWGSQLGDVWTCLADVRWGAQLADVPCIALGRRTCRRALRCIRAPKLWTCLVLRCVGVQNLGTCLALHWGTQLGDVGWGAQVANVPCVALGHPTCGCALRSVGAPNLRTCLVLRLGAHLVDAPCVALGHPTLVRPYQKVYLQAKICSYPSSSSSFSLVLPCVDVFVADYPSCELALRCVWLPNLQTCLVLHWGTQVADVRTCLALWT